MRDDYADPDPAPFDGWWVDVLMLLGWLAVCCTVGTLADLGYLR